MYAVQHRPHTRRVSCGSHRVHADTPAGSMAFPPKLSHEIHGRLVDGDVGWLDCDRVHRISFGQGRSGFGSSFLIAQRALRGRPSVLLLDNGVLVSCMHGRVRANAAERVQMDGSHCTVGGWIGAKPSRIGLWAVGPSSRCSGGTLLLVVSGLWTGSCLT